jgi:hypothetical protein
MTSLQETHSQSLWIAVWFSPRQAIDRILASRLRLPVVLLLVSLGGASFFVGKSLSLGWTYQVVNWRVLLFWTVAGAILGIVSVYLNALVFSWLGRYVGGCASALELRVAAAWSALPSIFGFLIAVLFLVVSRLFDHVSLVVPSGLLILVRAILAIGNIWSLVVFFVMISQVHQFEVRWAMVTYILGLASIALVAFLVRTFLGYVLDIPPDLFNISSYLQLIFL